MAQTVQEIDTSALERLRELQKDQVVLIDRLEQLKFEKENVSGVVYKRVLGDYEQRLRVIEDEARPLRRQAAEPYGLLMSALGKLEAEREELRFELEELELRHRIGELDEATIQEHRQSLGKRDSDVKTRLQEAEELRQRFLEAVDGEEEALRSTSSEEEDAPRETAAEDSVESVDELGDPDDIGDENEIEDEDPTADDTELDEPDLSDQAAAQAPSSDAPESSPTVDSDTEDETADADGAFPTFSAAHPETFDPGSASEDVDLGRTRLVAQQPPSPLAATSMMPLASLAREPDSDNGSAEIEVFPVEPFTAIGRTSDNQIQVDEISVSRHHAEIQLGPGGRYKARDLSSANGTFINGNSITTQDLLHGDVLQIGTVRFRFRVAGQDEE